MNNRTNKKESIQTDPWWLHNGGDAMKAFPEAPGALFSRFPDLAPLLGRKSGNREKRKKNCEHTLRNYQNNRRGPVPEEVLYLVSLSVYKLLPVAIVAKVCRLLRAIIV